MTERTREYFERTFKLAYAKTLKTVGYWQLPVIPPCTILPKGVVGFDQIKHKTPRDLFVHFHCWDDRFERIWASSERDIALLAQFSGLFMPDFSLFSDMSPADCIHNLRRCRIMHMWYLDNGFDVMPSAKWWDEESLELCLAGLPRHSLISISNVGVRSDQKSMHIFRTGYERVCKVLDPPAILLYGSRLNECYSGPPIFFYQNTHHSGEGCSYLNQEQLQLIKEA